MHTFQNKILNYVSYRVAKMNSQLRRREYAQLDHWVRFSLLIHMNVHKSDHNGECSIRIVNGGHSPFTLQFHCLFIKTVAFSSCYNLTLTFEINSRIEADSNSFMLSGLIKNCIFLIWSLCWEGRTPSSSFQFWEFPSKKGIISIRLKNNAVPLFDFCFRSIFFKVRNADLTAWLPGFCPEKEQKEDVLRENTSEKLDEASLGVSSSQIEASTMEKEKDTVTSLNVWFILLNILFTGNPLGWLWRRNKRSTFKEQYEFYEHWMNCFFFLNISQIIVWYFRIISHSLTS